jgi:hypothetical protein
LHFFWKDARAHLGGPLPLVFMLLAGIMLRSSLHNAVAGAAADGPLGDLQRQAQDEMMSAIKIGIGAYLSVLVSLYLAAVAATQVIASSRECRVASEVLSERLKSIKTRGTSAASNRPGCSLPALSGPDLLAKFQSIPREIRLPNAASVSLISVQNVSLIKIC